MNVSAIIAAVIGLVLLHAHCRPQRTNATTVNSNHFLNRYIANDGHLTAHWSEELSIGVRAGCGFTDGNKTPLGSLALWADPARAKLAIFVYRGIGDHCSEMQLLIFNELASRVHIVKLSSGIVDSYQCNRIP